LAEEATGVALLAGVFRRDVGDRHAGVDDPVGDDCLDRRREPRRLANVAVARRDERLATLRELLDAEKETVQIRAAEAILDRAGLTKASTTSTSTAKREIGGASKDDPLDNLL
jgi:hypothetical protein